jgi:acetyltransferase-like isoleucine patch superfamily enzyme
MTASKIRQAPGIQPVAESVSIQPSPSKLQSAWHHAGDVTTWLGRVSPATSFFPTPIRRSLLRLSGVRIGSNVAGLKHCGFETKHISIGDDSFVNVGCWFEGDGQIEIGRNVFLGPQVMILTSTHDIDAAGQVTREPVGCQVQIGDRCWLGARALVMPGVTIGEGTVIGAGAVVTKDCEPGALYAGVPAVRVR